MKRHDVCRRLGAAAVLLLMLTALCTTAAAFAVTADNTVYRTDTSPADGLRYETFYAEQRGAAQRGYLFTYTPGTSVMPVVTYGTHVWGRERTTAMASLLQKQWDADSGRVVGGINGDFFSMQTGIPLGVMIDDGQVLTSDAGAAALGMTADGTYLLGVPSIGVVLRVSDDTGETSAELPIAHINKYPAVWGAYLCTPAYGATTHSAEAGTEYVFRVEEGTFSIGGMVRAVLTEIREDCKNGTIPGDGFVIYMHPKCTQAAAYRALTAGDTVTVTLTAADGWENVTLALGGGDLLIENGTVQTDGFAVSHANAANPRTAVGYTADGRLLFFAVDGRTGASKGMTLAELAQTMASFGCVGAINLDGGGSTTVLVRADNGICSVTNVPSDGAERSVSNAVLFVDPTHADGIPYSAEILPDAPLVFGDAEVPLDVVIYDKSHTPVVTDSAALTWSAYGGVIDGGRLIPDAGADTVLVSVQVRIPASGTTGAAETVLTATETVYRTDSLDGITADASALTVPFGGSADPITVWGTWRGYPVHIAASDVTAVLTAPGGTQPAGYVDAALRVHSAGIPTERGEALLLNGLPTAALHLSVKDGGGKNHTTVLPVTFGALAQTVMNMEERTPGAVFRTDSAGHLAHVPGAGRNNTAAVSVTASMLAPIITPAASNPVRRIDLYLQMRAGALPEDLCAVVTFEGESCTLPWTVSDDFTRMGGWMRLSLDTASIREEGIRDFAIETLLMTASPMSAVIDDLTYFYGDRLPSFTDTHGTWAYDSIETAARMGVVRGIANGNGTYRYEPTGLLTRAEFAVMAVRFTALPLSDAPLNLPFADADSIPVWAAPYIAAVTEAGYMRGKTGGTDADGNPRLLFAADDTMTRAEVFYVLGEILKQNLYADDGTFGSFAQTAFTDDAAIPEWARANIVGMVGHGIVSGFDDNTIRPGAAVTRAETAALLCRVHDLLTAKAKEKHNR